MTELRFQFEVFEGPLDLLLHLVRKEEVDIYEVDMVTVSYTHLTLPTKA